MEPEMSLIQKCKFKDLIQLLRDGGGYKYSAKFFESLCCQKCCMILKQKSPKAPGKEPLHYSELLFGTEFPWPAWGGGVWCFIVMYFKKIKHI